MTVFKAQNQSLLNPLESNQSLVQNSLLENSLLNKTFFKASASGLIKDPGNTLSTAINIGILNNTKTFKDSVSKADKYDFYRLRLGANSNFNLSLTGISNSFSNNINVLLIRDINHNGVVNNNEIIASSTRGIGGEESINLSGLAQGTYYVQVYQASGNSNYTLSLSNSNPSNLLLNENDLGSLTNTTTKTGKINNNNTSDLYQFNFAGGKLNLSLTGVSQTAPNNVNVRLIRDTNNNGIVDAGEIIASSVRGVGGEESINRASLAAGKYFVQVYQSAGTSDYKLQISKTNTLLFNENNLGILNSTAAKVTGTVNSTNTAELYQFILGKNSNFNLFLTDFNKEDIYSLPSVKLIQDTNKNGVFDAGEAIAEVTIPTSQYGNVIGDGSINLSGLDAGTYFVQVAQGAEYTSSNYTLKLSTSNPSNLLLKEKDAYLGGASQNGYINNKITSDLYQFNFAGGNFNLSLTNISTTSPNNVNVRLIQDINNNGTVDNGEIIASSVRGVGGEESINRVGLAAGIYFIQVYQSAGASNYTLKTSTTAPSDLLLKENNLDSLSNKPTTLKGHLDAFTNTSDLYEFTLGKNSNLNLSLASNAQQVFLAPEARIINDINKNGLVDAGEVISSISLPASNSGDVVGDGLINLSGLDAGTYFVQVYQGEGFSANDYTLQLSSNKPSNLLSIEEYIYPTVSTGGFISNSNTSDIYGLVWGGNSNFNLSLTDVSQTSPNNIDVQLLKNGKVIASSKGGVGQKESINIPNLESGTYLVQVYQASGSSSYSLLVNAPFNSSSLINT